MLSWFKILTIFVISFSDYVSAQYNTERSWYSIPEPKVEVFTPRGFRISIGDAPGLKLFAFHGNINIELVEFDAGKYAHEVFRPQNGRWVVEEKSARLRVGDKLYYWVFVIKDNFAYRLDGRCFNVEELLPSPFLSASKPPPANTDFPYHIEGLTYPPKTKQPEYATYSPETSKDLLVCEETILNSTQVLISLRLEVEKLKKLNKQLINGLNEYPGSKQVSLNGRIPPEGSASSVTEFIIKEKLDLRPRILWAVREGNATIVFEVSSVVEKYDIIATAKEKLKNDKFKIS